MAKAASAGTDKGTTRRQKIVKWSAPSILADSMIDDGSERDVVEQQVGGEGQPEGRVGQPHPEERPVEVEVGDELDVEDARPLRVEAQDRDEGHLQRDDHQPDDQHEHHVAAPEVHPGEGVGGEGGDGDRDDRGGHRHREAVHEGVREAAGVQGGAVVLERPLAGVEEVGQGGPPPRGVGERLGPERGDQHPEGRDQPQDDDDEDGDADEPPARPIGAPTTSGCGALTGSPPARGSAGRSRP